MAHAVDRSRKAEIRQSRMFYEHIRDVATILNSSKMLKDVNHAFWTWNGAVTGVPYDEKKVRARMMTSATQRYEARTGMRLGSAEMEASIDKTIAAMQGN